MKDLKTIFEKLDLIRGLLYIYNHQKRDKNITKKELESLILQIDQQINWIDWITQLENYDNLKKLVDVL